MSRPPWAARRARAADLLREAPHAEEVLVFYVGLVELQERVADRVPVTEWLAAVRSPEGAPPLLRLDRLPADELLPLFEDFLAGLTQMGNEVIGSGATVLLGAGPAERAAALADRSGFHARAFLEPVVTSLASTVSGEGGGEDPSFCSVCGSRPVVGALRDLPDALGSRTLVCSLCASEWRFDRLRCAYCGETRADQLLVHTAESVPHVRVDECRSCERYLKTVDLRQRGDAVPLVDELATVELDLWARDKGLEKSQRNVLEL